MEEVKYFMWYDNYNNEPCHGPHYYCDVNKIGKKYYHTLDELLKTSISDSIKKRLIGAKIGTKIKIHYLHSNGDLMVKRVDENQMKILDTLTKSTKEWSKINEKLNQIEEDRRKLISKIKVR
jgi:hypothetical protein